MAIQLATQIPKPDTGMKDKLVSPEAVAMLESRMLITILHCTTLHFPQEVHATHIMPIPTAIVLYQANNSYHIEAERNNFLPFYSCHWQ